MNWRRGLFRLWCVAAAAWWMYLVALIVLKTTALYERHELNLAGLFKVHDGLGLYGWTAMGFAVALRVVVLGVGVAAGRLAVWVGAGFRAAQ